MLMLRKEIPYVGEDIRLMFMANLRCSKSS